MFPNEVTGQICLVVKIDGHVNIGLNCNRLKQTRWMQRTTHGIHMIDGAWTCIWTHSVTCMGCSSFGKSCLSSFWGSVLCYCYCMWWWVGILAQPAGTYGRFLEHVSSKNWTCEVRRFALWFSARKAQPQEILKLRFWKLHRFKCPMERRGNCLEMLQRIFPALKISYIMLWLTSRMVSWKRIPPFKKSSFCPGNAKMQWPFVKRKRSPGMTRPPCV